MAGYIGSKASVTQVDGYNRSEADAEFVQTTGDTMTGALAVNGNLTVDTNTLFVDAANNRVGIGTSSPQFRLVCAEAGTGVTSSLAIRAGEGGSGSTSNVAQLYFRIRGGGPGDVDGYFQSMYDGSNYVGRSDFLGGHQWYVNGSERARIDASGNLLVGKTTTSNDVNTQGFFVTNLGKCVITTPNGEQCLVLAKTGSSGTQNSIEFFYSGSPVGSVTTTTTATSYNTSSDYRLKENVVPLAGAADRLAQIPVHRFNFIADPDRTVDGFLAHEVQAFVPECVTGEKDQVETVEVTDEDGNVTTETRPVYQGIDQSKLVPLLTAALQEALTKIEQLEARMAILEGGAA